MIDFSAFAILVIALVVVAGSYMGERIGMAIIKRIEGRNK